jgi:hypothetical protein
MSHSNPFYTYQRARKAICATLGPVFTLTIAGVPVGHDNEHDDDVIVLHHEHTHQEELPDKAPVGRQSIEVISSGSASVLHRQLHFPSVHKL